MDTKESKTGKELVQDILSDILQSDKDLLNNKDDLIKRLQDEIDKNGSLSRYINPLIKALENKVGEVLFVADSGSDEEKENAKLRIQDILRKVSMRDKSINDVLESFTYALKWNEKDEPEEIIQEEPDEIKESEINNNDVADKKDTWLCSCGTENTDNFCVVCGKPKPANVNEWICPNCGSNNTGNFCVRCGSPKKDNIETPIDDKLDETQIIEPIQDVPKSIEPIAPKPIIEEDIKKPEEPISAINKAEEPQYIPPQNNTYVPPQSNSPAKKSSKKGYVAVIGILLVLVIVFGVKAMSSNDDKSSSSPAIATSSSSDSPSKKNVPEMKSDLSLGGVELSETIDQVHDVLGKEDSIKTKDGYEYHNYASIMVGMKDGKVDALVSNDSSVQTKRGIHQGSSAQDVFDKYGTDYAEMNYDDLTLYEYSFNALDGRAGLLRFAINKSDNTVSYISIRIPDDTAANNTSNNVANPQNEQAAKQTITAYYGGISNHNLPASYNLLSSDMQNHMGSMNDFASGYKTTISNSVSNIHVISSTENQVIINYDLTAKDRANGNRVKIQYFNGTATLSNATGSWHIVDMTVKKTGEHME